MAEKEVIHSELAPAAVGPYSHAVAANNLVFTSGQVAIDPKTGKVYLLHSDGTREEVGEARKGRYSERLS